MRYPITLAMAFSLLGVSAQQEGTIALVARPATRDSVKVRTPNWSGSGGKFALDQPTLGQPIEPIPMRAVTWEFGDGSLSHILPPRPWRPSDGIGDRSASMAPFRERNGGSPCVSVAEGGRSDDNANEPRPVIVSEGGQPVLVTTGLGARHLQVRMLEAIGGDGAPTLEQHFVSGRWALEGASDVSRPVFITLQDLSTGERWRAGIDP